MTSTRLRALIVEDSEDDAVMLVRELRRGGYDPCYERVETREAMSAALDRQEWDLVLADYTMPQFSGTAALALLKQRELDLPFIFVSGTIGEDTAVAAMKNGAHDYIMKDNLTRLLPAIERELREAKMRRERRQAEARIQHLAFYDPLTDLPNRTLFHDRLQQAIRIGQRQNKPVALLIADLDRFKEINDTLGHHVGDVVLQEVGHRIRSVLREPDTVARLGGDEFAVLMHAVDRNSVVSMSQRILEALEPPVLKEGLELDVSASIGIALSPDHGTDADLLIQRADVAMYLAKEARSGFAVYAPELDRFTPQRLALIGELRQAIERRQLILHYQPKVALQTGDLLGVEALVRWQHPRLGMLPSGQFIGLAEETGFIKALTHWVLFEAVRQHRAWRRERELDLSVAVNLPPRRLHDLQIPDHVERLRRKGSMSPRALQFEITENALMADPVRTLDVLTRLHQMDVQLAIDDFGTGYSSLGYLRELPVDEIKIDKSFVLDMALHRNEAIVRSTIELAHNLGLGVVAEGVATRQLWNRLKALGCDAAQGYYVSAPLPASAVPMWLEEWASTVRSGG